MASLRQIPPTAGYPVYARDLLRLGARGNLAQDMRDLLGVAYARITCSGTVALYLTLDVIRDLMPRRAIIIPAFICPLVGLAAARAGFSIALCDMQADGQLDYDLAQLDALCRARDDIAAIVVPHLGGLPADVAAIKAITDPHGILLIEDCAQALGAEYQGKKTGTMGDFAFFSFARGKGLTLYEGGVLVTNRAEYAAALDAAYERIVPKNWAAELGALGGLFGYALFYRPWLFWFIFDITYLLWNRLGDEVRAAAEYNRLDFPIYRMMGLRRRLGHAFFRHIRPQIVRQWESAQRTIADLKGKGDFRIIEELPGSRATYMYVALIFPTRARRDAMLQALRARGLGAFIIYVRAMVDYDYMKPHLPPGHYPNAARIADCTMTLSTSLFLQERDRQAILQILGGSHHA